MKSEKRAFVLRCKPSGKNKIKEVIEGNQIVIGWSHTKMRLFDMNLNRDDFKKTIYEIYPTYSSRGLGQATGHLWRFFREMQIGDYVLVPIPYAFYLGKIKSEVKYFEDKIKQDTALRRDVDWLNDGNPILRVLCDAGLITRLKYQGTCANASDLIDSIDTALQLSIEGKVPSFKEQLNEKLKKEVSSLIASKKAILNPDKFEDLVQEVLRGLGAEIKIKPSKKRYKNSIADVDVIADFRHLLLRVFVQVKHHIHETDEYAISQMIKALDIEGEQDLGFVKMGWVVTSAKFSEKALQYASDNGIRCVDGEELAEMIVSIGLDNFDIT